MNKAIKGAMLSGLVLPGLGQMVLKCYIRGVLLLLASLGCVAVLVAEAVEQATAIIGKIDSVNVAIDPAAFLNSANQTGAAASGSMYKVASLVLLLIWLGGTVDAWLIGRGIDLRERGGL